MGWDVQVRKDESKLEQFEKKIAGAAHSIAEQLGLDDDLADKLFRAGGMSVDLVADMDVDYISQAIGVPEERAEDILSRAKANAASA